ncbi:MAG: hypothetical protein KC589_10160 [Nanoarchaeota archaeon]|nr:hypothetical protein [Nanoarchaeota archaeon]
MNRREFLLRGGILGLGLTSPYSFANSSSSNKKKNSNNSSLDKQISYLRSKAKEVPSGNLLREHWKNIIGDFNSDLDDAERNFKISKSKKLLPIIGVEYGKPYEGYPSGFDVESPSGCKGLAQFSFAGFYDACNWVSLIGEKRDLKSSLDIFSPFLSDKERMRDIFDKIFKSQFFDLNGQIISSGEIQIGALGAYFNKLMSHLNNASLAFYSYNIGLESTIKLLEKYAEIKVGERVNLSPSPGVYDFNTIRSLSKLYNITPQTLLAIPQVSNYFDEIKAQKGLFYMDKSYYDKIQIAQLELKKTNLV